MGPTVEMTVEQQILSELRLLKNELFKGAWGDEDDYAVLEEEWATMPATSDISWTTEAPASDSSDALVSPPA